MEVHKQGDRKLKNGENSASFIVSPQVRDKTVNEPMERELSQVVAHGIGVAAAFGGSIFKPLVGGSKFTLHEVLLLPACSIYTMNPIVVVIWQKQFLL